MSGELEPAGGDLDPVRAAERIEKVRATEVGTRRIVDDGVQELARGALVCPGCAMPIFPGGPVSIAVQLRCGFCRHSGRAREFLVPDVYDTVGNEVFVIARVAPIP